jgi:Flp pilus assembly protein TadG
MTLLPFWKSAVGGADRPGSRRPRRRGAALVEFAILAPIFFAFVMGSIEFGRAMMVLNTLGTAARNGTRVGVITGNSDTDVTTAVNNALTSAGITATPTISVKVNGSVANCNTAITGDSVEVDVSISALAISWLPTTWFLSGNLEQMAVMRHE